MLARIDDSLYAAAVKTAQAQVEQAEANVLASEANVLQMKAKLLQATQDWGRAQKLGPSDALAQSAYDQYQANYEVAKANLAAAEAAVEQAKAALAAGEGQPPHGADKPRLLYDQIAGEGRRNRQAGEYRADRRFLAQRAEPLPHRERPETHSGVGLRQ